MKIKYKLKESLDQAHELSSLIQQSQNKEILFYLTDSRLAPIIYDYVQEFSMPLGIT